MGKNILFAALGVMLYLFTGLRSDASEKTFSVSSPDGLQRISLSVGDVDGATVLSYSTWYDGKEVILPSGLDLTMDNRTWEKAMGKDLQQPDRWFDNLKVTGCDSLHRDTVWHNAYGERSTVRDAFNALIVHFEKFDGSQYRLDIELRAYDEGVAFRYCFPAHPDGVYHRVLAENTEFSLPEGAAAWYTSWAQGPYELRPLNGAGDSKDVASSSSERTLWEDECERPVTLKIRDSLWAAVGEAAQIDFPRCKFRLSEQRACTLATSLNDVGTDFATPYNMPWRVIMAAESAGKLLENNDIFLNLNEPSQISDESWIRPGKIMREILQTTENSLSVIDFCSAHNISYMLYDAKWYGPEHDPDSDATTVKDGLDLQKAIAYGKEKGVGVWLYVNQLALQRQAEELFPLFHEWGVVGVKFGFVEFASQHWAEWLHRLVRLAAENHLMVNIHDEYRPTGYSRTWPNLLTQEGIRGNEEFPSAAHNTVLPFTRMLCGAADYTVCYFDPRLVKTTHAHQLALPVVLFSPLQTLYWYDYPARIENVGELEFFDAVPTVWDETRVLDDDMGEHVCIARRSDSAWYVGVLNGDSAHAEAVPTDFLAPGAEYVAKIYTDSPCAVTLTDGTTALRNVTSPAMEDDGGPASPTGVRVSSCVVRGGETLNVDLLPGGGAAIQFIPKDII